MAGPARAAAGGIRSRLSLGAGALLASLLMLSLAFVLLGTWQVHRRAWKLDLIQRVEQRVHAVPVPAPVHDAAARVGRDDEYRHVRIDGRFLNDRSTKVMAVTEYGPGFWVMTPLQREDGFVVLVNRGFVEHDDSGPTSDAVVSVTGLLRLTEPGGGFLRRNEPASHRWFSRDIAAIAAAAALPADQVAPYFIDADATPDAPAGQPVGGLTVIRFHNSHLVYAITWYALALMSAGALFVIGRQEWRLRRGSVIG